jgi:hypothetical protein
MDCSKCACVDGGLLMDLIGIGCYWVNGLMRVPCFSM